MHLVNCQRCGVSYKATHYHCCVCGRVFRSASAFETHQKAREGRGHPATDAQLQRLGLVLNENGAWMGQGTFSKTRYAKAGTGGYTSDDGDAA